MAKNYAYIGTERFPLPYMKENGELALLRDDNTYIRLPVMHDGTPAEVQAKVYGRMWRSLPTRSALNELTEVLRRRSDNVDDVIFKLRRRGAMRVGRPGCGKTHLLKAVAKMIDPEGGIYVNCKDKDMKTLIVRTELDTSNIDVEKNAIDARIKMYNSGTPDALSQAGIDTLKKMFGSAVSVDEDGKLSLDWLQARGNIQYTSNDKEKEFVSLLQQFCKRENIDYTYNLNNVGFVEKDGELLEAIESGRPIILDELNRGKNQDYLLPYMDFLNGSYEDIKITGANGRVVNISKDKLPDTFMLDATGNPETVEMGIKEKMSEPLKDRFDISEMGDFHPKDFTDMYCTLMTGVPVSIVRDAYKIENEEDLATACINIRTMGLSKQEIASIPPEQMMYLENAGQFLEAAECVGRTLYEIYQFKGKTLNSACTTEYCEDQVLRQHIKEKPYSFRILEDICNRARTYVPQRAGKVSDNPLLQGFDFVLPSGGNTWKMRLRTQGEGWEKAIEGAVKDIFTCQGMNPEIGGNVLGMANNILSHNGIGEETYMETIATTQTRLKDMFDFPIPGEKPEKKASKEALAVQEMICKMIRDRYPASNDKSNDEIMDPFVIEGVLATIRENPVERHAVMGKAILVNSAEDSNNQTPFIKNAAVVETENLGEDAPEITISTDDLAEAEAFLNSLTIKGVSDNNLATIWPNIHPLFVYSLRVENPEADYDESIFTPEEQNVMKVLSGNHKYVAYNSFMMKDEEGKPVMLDIVNVKLPDESGEMKNHTMIVGDKIPPILAVRLKQNDITYIDRTESTEIVQEGGKNNKKISAENKIKNWLDQMDDVCGGDTGVKELVEQAVNEKFSIFGLGLEVPDIFKKGVADRRMDNRVHITNFTTSELDKGTDKSKNAVCNALPIWQALEEKGR